MENGLILLRVLAIGFTELNWILKGVILRLNWLRLLRMLGETALVNTILCLI